MKKSYGCGWRKKFFVMGSKKLFCYSEWNSYTYYFLFESALSGIAKAYDENLWVSCTNPASINKVNPLDYTVESHALDVSIGAGWGVAPAFLRKMILFISVMQALICIDIFSLKIRRKSC